MQIHPNCITNNIFVILHANSPKAIHFSKENAICPDLSPFEKHPHWQYTTTGLGSLHLFNYALVLFGSGRSTYLSKSTTANISIFRVVLSRSKRSPDHGIELCFNFKRRVSSPPASILVTKCRTTRKYASPCFNRSFFFRNRLPLSSQRRRP